MSMFWWLKTSPEIRRLERELEEHRSCTGKEITKHYKAKRLTPAEAAELYEALADDLREMRSYITELQKAL
jgi:hypothetical protein